MRIAFLSTFYPYRGGIAQFSGALLRALENQGHEVKAFNFTRQYPEFLFPGKTQLVNEKDTADQIESDRVLDSINPISYLATSNAINKYNPDVLLTSYWMPFFAPAMGTIARNTNRKTKVISLLHNVVPHEKRFFDKAFSLYFIAPHDGFITLTSKVDKDLHELAPAAKSMLHPHPLYDHFGNKVDKELALKKLGIAQNKKVLLFFGFIRDYKGLDILLDAFSRLDSSYHLLIAGEVYGSFDKYQEQIDKHPLKDHISIYSDYISDSEVPTFFCASDVCILPYRSATQSGITSISYHFDLPMIATNVGGLKETIFHNETGIMCEEPEANQLADAIKEYFKNGNAERFKKGISKLKNDWSWNTLAVKAINFIEQL